MRVVVIDYGMGNLRSVQKAFKRLNYDCIISSKEEDIENADKLILPGVGHFEKGIEKLNKSNLIPLLNKKVLNQETPILGICLGMQLMTTHSEEGNIRGLNWIDARTKKITIPKNQLNLRIPHIGWNSIRTIKSSILTTKLDTSTTSFYFVHSYFVSCNNDTDNLYETEYGLKFTSAFQKKNIFGTQFHPEKSHKDGLQLLRNFIELS